MAKRAMLLLLVKCAGPEAGQWKKNPLHGWSLAAGSRLAVH